MKNNLNKDEIIKILLKEYKNLYIKYVNKKKTFKEEIENLVNLNDFVEK